MIVCICKNISSSQILEAFEEGVHTLEDVRAHTGAGSCCGKCQFKINALIQGQSIRNQHDHKQSQPARIAG